MAALLSPDNTTRSQAEEQFGKIPVPVKLPNLVTMLRTHGASDEGCEKEMIPILADVVNAILPFCHDQT
ncbi:hypothetical protein EMCRGX_G026012 [Ephydatia muelleri]